MSTLVIHITHSFTHLNNYFISVVRELIQKIDIFAGDSFGSFRTLTASRSCFNYNIINADDINNIVCNMEVNKSPGFENTLLRFYLFKKFKYEFFDCKQSKNEYVF